MHIYIYIYILLLAKLVFFTMINYNNTDGYQPKYQMKYLSISSIKKKNSLTKHILIGHKASRCPPRWKIGRQKEFRATNTHNLENVVMSEGFMGRYFLTWPVTWKAKTPKTSRRVLLYRIGLMLENRKRTKERRGGCGGSWASEEERDASAVEEVCVCDRCFMVREFVLLKGGVSEWPAAGWMWIWHSAISHENTLLVF